MLRIDRNNTFQSVVTFPGRRWETFSIALHFISRCFCGCHEHLATIIAQTFFAALLYSFHDVRRMDHTPAIVKCRIGEEALKIHISDKSIPTCA